MRIYGASDKRNILESQLAWAIPRQRGPPPRGSAPSVVGPSYAESSYAYSQPSSSQRVASGGIVNQAREEAIKKQQEALHRAAELKQMLTSLEKVDDEGRRASLLDTLCSSDDILNLPEHPNPPSIASGELVVNLLRHQVPYFFSIRMPSIFSCILMNRVKPCSGALNTSALLCQLKSLTGQSNSGDTARRVTRSERQITDRVFTYTTFSALLLQP